MLGRKGSKNLAVAAIARKLTVGVWYLMMGRWTPLEEIDDRLHVKIGKILTQVGRDRIQKLGKTRKVFRQEVHDRLKTGKVYVLDPTLTYVPRAATALREKAR